MAFLSVPFNGSLKRKWMQRKYQRLNGVSRSNMRVVKLGAGGTREKRTGWRIRPGPKLRLRFLSPMKLWSKMKTAYMDMMLRLAGKAGALSGTGAAVYGGGRIPSARKVSLAYREQEFDNRVVYEIYKSLVVSLELKR